MDFWRIGRIGYIRLAQPAFTGTRFRGQNMTGECVPAFDLAGTRLFEPLGRTLMGFELWHGFPKKYLSLGMPPEVAADFQSIADGKRTWESGYTEPMKSKRL